MKRALILGDPAEQQPADMFVRPAPFQLLGALVRNPASGHFGRVLYMHFLPLRVILECHGHCAPENTPEAFEVVLLYQEVYGDLLYQLVCESPYLDWEWLDTEPPGEVGPRWRALPNEE